MPAEYVNTSWGYYLEPVDAATTRLVVRSRLDYRGSRALSLVWRVTEVLNYVMERKMLATIRHCAERDAKQLRLQPAAS
jgi:hypothetical protein